MNIAGKLPQVGIIFNKQTFEPALKKMTGPGVFQIKTPRIGNTQPWHILGKIGLLRTQEKMIMVTHKNIGKYFNFKTSAVNL